MSASSTKTQRRACKPRLVEVDAEPLPHLVRQVGGRDGRERRAPRRALRNNENDQQQSHQRQPAHVDQTQHRRLLFREWLRNIMMKLIADWCMSDEQQQ